MAVFLFIDEVLTVKRDVTRSPVPDGRSCPRQVTFDSIPMIA